MLYSFWNESVLTSIVVKQLRLLVMLPTKKANALYINRTRERAEESQCFSFQ